ncbi:MAG TPA: hypothetical protein VGW38_11445 [Chloroflexota bacterium]|nr:hypothetical protein [Chloroflexota bacterium]
MPSTHRAYTLCLLVLSATVTLILLLMLPAKSIAFGALPTADAPSRESDHADVARAFLRATCSRKDASALAMLAPGARVMQSSWGLDQQGNLLIFSYLLNRPGSETDMLRALRRSACLPITNLEVDGAIVTWQQDLWPDADADFGEEHIRWHYRALLSEGQLAEIARAAALPDRDLPPPPISVPPTSQPNRGAELLPVANLLSPAQLERPRSAVSVGPAEAVWPLVLLPILAGAVILLWPHFRNSASVPRNSGTEEKGQAGR